MGSSAGGLQEARRRIKGLVSIAAAHDSCLSLEDLNLLLPEHLFPTVGALEQFVLRDGQLAEQLVVSGGELAPRGREGLIPGRPAQRELNQERRSMAHSFASKLASRCSWIYTIGITGSMAYDGPHREDDIDLFLAVGRRRLWVTLLLAMVMARKVRHQDGGSPVYCFNRAVEYDRCGETFRTFHDSLFAREALNVKVLVGEEYYRGLLSAAPWMGEYFPRLYNSRLDSPPSPSSRKVALGRAPWDVLDFAAFFALAPYLWAVGLVRNRRLRRAGNHAAEFRTVIAPGFCAFESAKYDTLREEYRRFFEDGFDLQ